jgi:hypothetical protein
LGLLSGSPLTPWLRESLVLLGTSVPFAQAADLLHHFTGVRVGAETVRRLTEAAGAAQTALETELVAELERTLPDEPSGSAVLLLSVDGAMAPLVGGEWAEVKTLALGVVTADAAGPRTTALSYFSRLSDAATFARLATVETHRRGTSAAGTVVAVTDGARWCQGFIDWHRPDAVRVLDFPHAVEHLGTVAQSLFGPGTAVGSEWLGVQAHRLRHGQETAVMTALAERAAAERRPEVRAVLEGTRAYLAARADQLHYQAFAAAGYPIGSGCVESANKLVVEARLKGAGMHWARTNVNPLLALRALVANDRWDEAWPRLWQSLCASRRRSPVPAVPPAPTPAVVADPPPLPAAPRQKTIINGKPTANHPWNRGFASRAKS